MSANEQTIWSRLNPYWLWLLLALPGVGMTVELVTSSDPRVFRELLHPTGEFAARFMIIALLASPLALIFRKQRWPRWLQRNRRYFGVAAFFYALAHTVLYLVDEGTVAAVVADIPKLYIWTGWVAFIIFVPLAITSTDGWVRRLGRTWKTLQRTTYVAAVFTLLHWAALHDWEGVAPALVHFGPLAMLEAYRAWYWMNRRTQSA